MAKKTDLDSVTDSQTPDEQLELERSKAELLGPNPLKRTESQNLCLLRLTHGDLKPELAGHLGESSYEAGQETLLKKGKPTLVLGPFSFDELHELAKKKLISPQDYIIRSFDRWKSVAVNFPELRSAFGTLEDTSNMSISATGSAAGTGFTETPTPTADLNPQFTLQVEEPDEVVLPIQEEAIQALQQEAGQLKERDGRSFTPQEIEERLKKARIQRPRTDGPSVFNSLPFTLLSILAVLGMVSLALNKDRIKALMLGDASNPQAPLETIAVDGSEPVLGQQRVVVPEDLAQRDPESLNADDDWIVKKIRPILTAAERGNRFLSSDQEALLKKYAAAGTASWTAQRLAANQLAVFYMSNGQSAQAHRYLDSVYQSDVVDPATLINRAVLSLIERKPKEARSLADAAVRLNPPGMAWVAYAVDGMVEAAPGSGGNVMEAERLFNRAKEASSNNPYVFGIWIQALMQASAEWRSAIPKLLKEALWSDPDRSLDSPIRAPVAGAILVSQALDGFRQATEKFGSTLKPGQIAFLKWQESRKSLNPLATPLSQVSKILSTEDDALSRLLFAYTLKELGNTAEALKVMEALMPILESNPDVKSSYPWCFMADLLWTAGRIDDSGQYYERALRRNRSDVSSVFGLAIVARALGDYSSSRQKLAETLSLDPSFVPALLRQPRFEWHARLQAK